MSTTVFRINLTATFDSYAIVAAPSESAAVAALLRQRALLRTLFDNFAHPSYTIDDEVIVMGADEVDIDRPNIDLVVR